MSGLLYVSRQSAEGLGDVVGVQPDGGQLTAQATARFGQSVEGFGDQLAKISEKNYAINRETQEAQRTTQFITGVDQLNQKYQNDPDPSTAAQRYNEEVTKLREQALDGFDPQTRPQLDLKFQRHQIAAVGNQRFDALKRQADQYTGNLDQQYHAYTTRYAAAKTDQERQAVAGELEGSLQSGLQKGMITHKNAEGYRQALLATGDEALALRLIGSNPAAASAALRDPNRYTGINPVRKQQLADHAKAAEEERRAAGIIQQARFNPAEAAFSAGRLTDPRQAELVFDRAIIPQESVGNPNAFSGKGAMGVSQIMPDTARGVAERLGMTDIAGMGNLALRQRLTSDPALARKLGLAYFQENLKTFNGNLAPAIAAYHAGPGKAVAAAHAKATETYGEGYTPEQFLSFMPTNLHDGTPEKPGKRTVDYVRDIFRRMGARTDAPAMSPMASYRLSNAVGQQLDQEVARREQVITRITKVAGQEADELAPILKDGYQPDPMRVAAVRGSLQLAANRGDAAAAEKLRSFEDALAIAPMVNQIYRMKPEQIDAELATARQQMALGIVTPQQRQHVQLLEKVSGEVATARKDNQIALAERQGIAQATPVNVGVNLASPEELNSFRTQLAQRTVASDGAFKLYAGTQQFFRPEERYAMKQRWQEMGENDRFGLLKEMAGSISSPAAYRAAVTEMTGGDGHIDTAARFMRTNPELSRAIMTGAAYLEQPSVKPKVDDIKKGIAKAFGGDMLPGTEQGRMIDAALAVYAADRGKNGALYDPHDSAGIERAVERVIGRVEKINGRRVPVPIELAGSGRLFTGAFADAFHSLTQQQLETMGGSTLDAVTIRRYGQLVPMGLNGRYAVVMPGPGGEARPVFKADKITPLEIDAAELIKALRKTESDRLSKTALSGRNAALHDHMMRGSDGKEVWR